MQTISVILGTVLLASSWAWGQNEVTCSVKLNASSLPEGAPITANRFSFQLDPVETVSSLQVRTRDTRPIDSIAAVADLYKDDQYVMSVIFEAVTEDHKSQHPLSLPTSPLITSPQILFATLTRGDEIEIIARSPVRPLECPEEARIAFLETSFSEGAIFTWHGDGWRTDALLADAEPWEIETSIERGHYSALTRVTIDETGHPHVISVSTDIHDKMTQELDDWRADWITDEIETKWRFVPAIYNGVKITSEAWLLFQFSLSKPQASLTAPPFVNKEWVKSLSIIEGRPDPILHVFGISYGNVQLPAKRYRMKSQ
jgi:hypothetical protein